MKTRWALGSALVVIVAAAHADDLTTYSTLTGRCTAAMTMDTVVDPARCANKIVNITFPSGRLGFMFLLNKQGAPEPALFSFFGDGARRMHPKGGTAVLPIDRVYFTVQGSTDDFAATGSCSVVDSGKGAAAHIACSAKTDRGTFTGYFVSDGTAPETDQPR